MILECSQCHSRYLVPDTAIGPEGRSVRCANCRHNWFQPPAGFVPAPVATPEPVQPVVAAPPPAPAPIPEPAYASDDTDYDAFAHEPPFRARRNPARIWTIAAVTTGIAMLIAAGALVFGNLSGVAAMLGLPLNSGATPLKFVNLKKPDRRDLPSGSELFAIGGQVQNPTSQRQNVPDIRVDLLDAQREPRIVYSWVIRPDQRTIAPGGLINIESGRLDVPPSARTIRLSFATASAAN
jgi:predicted Zn finger-like uncharacterized protein